MGSQPAQDALSNWWENKMRLTFTRRGFVRVAGMTAAAAAGLGGATQALAAPLAKPEGKVVLSISGLISNTNNGDKAEFDMPMLEGARHRLLDHQDALVQGSGHLQRRADEQAARGGRRQGHEPDRHRAERLCHRHSGRGLQDPSRDAGDQARRQLHAGPRQGPPLHRLQLRFRTPSCSISASTAGRCGRSPAWS